MKKILHHIEEDLGESGVAWVSTVYKELPMKLQQFLFFTLFRRSLGYEG